MHSTDLAFYTCDELIRELLARKTFYGCVVHTAEEHKHEHWDERTFRVHFNQNLDRQSAGRLLDRIAEYLNIHSE
jgi:hypothetical protein